MKDYVTALNDILLETAALFTRFKLTSVKSVRRQICRWSLIAFLGATAPAFADWPAYRRDIHRSSVTEEKLSLPLRLAWQYVLPQPPSPAWPDVFRLLHRLDFDHAPYPVIAQGIVYFGSSADDTVRALDAKTGQEKWHFITGGPVRFAPQIEKGKVFFAADDGFVYCVDSGTGKLIWKFQAALRDERMIGNHRMISRWPVRTGVLVSAGVVYCAAGMWDMEGVFVYALQADTGKVVWCNDTLGFSGASFVDYSSGDDPSKETVGGHNGEFAAGGVNPQGNLLLWENTLIVPNGNAGPAALDRLTGLSSLKGGGSGTPVTIDGEKVYAFGRHHEDILSLIPFSLGSAAAGRAWGRDSIPQVKITAPKPGQIQDRTKVSAVVHNGKLYARMAYGLALAGEILLVGENNAIVAQDPNTERVLWRAGVTGEARAIAVADGRLYVGTSTGVIYCFASGGGVPPLSFSGQGREASAATGKVSSVSANILEQLHSAGMDRGFALVVGDAEGQMSTALAAETQLKVINALTNEVAATALREKLLAQTAWYGSRIHVHTVARLDRLPFAQYFANAVVVAAPLQGLSGRELYRVLRPCGGILLSPGLSDAESRKLFGDAGAAESEIRAPDKQAPNSNHRTPNTTPAIVRGKLSGALDWDSNRKELPADQRVTADLRVKWPLRNLWFGGPGTRQVQGVKGGGGPVAANGRYFVMGEQSLTAVDAYNGAILWSHALPLSAPDYCTVDGLIYPVADATKFGREPLNHNYQANNDFVYFQLGSAYFQTIGDKVSDALGEALPAKGTQGGRIQLDARTGEQLKIAAPFNPSPIISLKTPQKWSLEVNPRRSGDIALEATERGLVLTLATKDTLVTKLDAWDLFFDFRFPATRYGLYERGTFQVRVVVAQDEKTPAAWTPGNGPVHPTIEVTGTRDAAGTKTVVVLPWTEIQKLTGMKPASFGFAVTLNAHDGGRDEPIVRRHLFCDWTASGLNNGWACVVLGGATASAETGKRPTILVDSIAGGGGIGGNGDNVTPVREAPRIHPLTGDLEPKMFRKGGCTGLSSSAFLRSGSQSFYDFADDSGMRALGSIKARCSTPQIMALGLLLFSEENGHCECPYPVRTTLVMAPAEQRLNEDWAFFFARPADTYLRQAAINFGAPGDRRDDAGTLWLGYPRVPANKSMAFPIVAGKQSSVGANGVWLRILSAALQVPLEVECFGGTEAYRPEQDSTTQWGWKTSWIPNRNHKEFGPYRINADRADIRGTDRPWIYASGYRGIRKAVMKLNFLQPVVSAAVDKAPTLNDKSDGPVWQGGSQAGLPFTKTEIFVRHDAENLYIVARRPTATNRLGKVLPWAKTTAGADAKVWDDDSFEVFLSDDTSSLVVHLGVSASGARFDALSGSGDQREDSTWNGVWQSAVLADKTVQAHNPAGPPKKAEAGAQPPLVIELIIPWKTIEAAGLKKDHLGVNFQMNQKDTSGMSVTSPGSMPGLKPQGTSGEALCYLGIRGREHCQNFAPLGFGAPPKIEPRSFTVRLHFAELDDVKPGQRVFDVKLQDQVVLKNFDVVKEAGNTRTALVKEFKNIRAADALTLELVPSAKPLAANCAPILSGIEVFDENFKISSKL